MVLSMLLFATSISISDILFILFSLYVYKNKNGFSELISAVNIYLFLFFIIFRFHGKFLKYIDVKLLNI